MTVLILDDIGKTGTASFRQHAEINVFQGSPLDKITLIQALNGCEALVSALNISRRSDFPSG